MTPVLLLLLLLLLALLVLLPPSAGGPPEGFTAPAWREKAKNMTAYFGVAGERSAAGDWTQRDAQALQVLAGLVGAPGAGPEDLYQAQGFLRRRSGYGGRVDGVPSEAYRAAAAKFLASFDAQALALAARAVAFRTDTGAGAP